MSGRLRIASLDMIADRTEKLKQLFPRFFREGKVDLIILKKFWENWWFTAKNATY